VFGGKVQESNKDRCAAALQEKEGSVIADIHATIRTASRLAFGRAEAGVSLARGNSSSTATLAQLRRPQAAL